MRTQSGFTLVEMMVVIAIIAIVSAFTIPNMIAWRNNAQLSQAARQIYSDLQLAKKTAIKSNTTITVDFGVNDYTIFRGGTAIANRAMPPGISIDSAAFVASGNVASFNNMGFGRDFLSADNNGAVIISRNGGGRTVTIQVSSGGGIRII